MAEECTAARSKERRSSEESPQAGSGDKCTGFNNLLTGEKMNRFRALVTILCLTLGAFAPPVRMNAESLDKKAFVTFSKPVEIPGIGAQVLPVGKYVFKLLELSSNRNIVQIFNEGQTHLYATILAISRKSIPSCHYMVAVFGGTDIRCAEYATYGTKALAENAVKALKDRSGCLLVHRSPDRCIQTLLSPYG